MPHGKDICEKCKKSMDDERIGKIGVIDHDPKRLLCWECFKEELKLYSAVEEVLVMIGLMTKKERD